MRSMMMFACLVMLVPATAYADDPAPTLVAPPAEVAIQDSPPTVSVPSASETTLPAQPPVEATVQTADSIVAPPAPPPLETAPPPPPSTPMWVAIPRCMDRSRGVSYPCPKNPRYKFIGMLFDISVPSGVALGIEGRIPYAPWFKLGLAGTATIAPGIRGNVMFDPIKFPVAPILNVDLGHQFPFSIPGVSNSPSVEFSYTDLNAGLGFGSREEARFLLMSGGSYLFGSASNFQGLVNPPKGLTLGNPSFTGWVPNIKLGFDLLF